jgi:transposase-like protein
MADIRRIVNLYELYGSYKKVARELDISPNTAKKYVLRVKDVQEGVAEEILPKDRKIIQPSRVLTWNNPENSDSLPNEFGNSSSEMATKSVTPALKTK